MNAEGKKYGSMDNARPAERMAAIDAAMRRYFNSEDWLKARAQEFPGIRRG